MSANQNKLQPVYDNLGVKKEVTLDQVQHVYGQLPTPKEAFYDWWGLNEKLFTAINKIHSDSYDMLMLFFTQLGDKKHFLPYMVVLTLCALLSILIKKRRKKGGVNQYAILWMGVFLVLGISMAMCLTFVPWLKEILAYPRPYMILDNVIQVEFRDADSAYASLPSGHTMFVSLIVFSLWPVLSHRNRMIGGFCIALVAWTRIALGVHFPADVVWAVILSFGIVFVARFIVTRIMRNVFRLNYCDR